MQREPPGDFLLGDEEGLGSGGATTGPLRRAESAADDKPPQQAQPRAAGPPRADPRQRPPAGPAPLSGRASDLREVGPALCPGFPPSPKKEAGKALPTTICLSADSQERVIPQQQSFRFQQLIALLRHIAASAERPGRSCAAPLADAVPGGLRSPG